MIAKNVLALLALVVSFSAFADDYEVRFPYEERSLAPALSAEPDPQAWGLFAEERSLAYSDWNEISWGSSSLTSIPFEIYPLSQPSGNIFLQNNGLSDITGLSGLTFVGGTISLGSNNLTNVNNLSNLTSVGGSVVLSNNNINDISGLSNLISTGSGVSVAFNDLTNVDGLSNLTNVGHNLALHGNPLNSLNGVSNVNVVRFIFINADYSGAKLPAESTFCTLNTPDQFQTGYATKNQVCE